MSITQLLLVDGGRNTVVSSMNISLPVFVVDGGDWRKPRRYIPHKQWWCHNSCSDWQDLSITCHGCMQHGKGTVTLITGRYNNALMENKYIPFIRGLSKYISTFTADGSNVRYLILNWMNGKKKIIHEHFYAGYHNSDFKNQTCILLIYDLYILKHLIMHVVILFKLKVKGLNRTVTWGRKQA